MSDQKTTIPPQFGQSELTDGLGGAFPLNPDSAEHRMPTSDDVNKWQEVLVWDWQSSRWKIIFAPDVGSLPYQRYTHWRRLPPDPNAA